MIGQRISNFQIVKELGAGGMGTVYQAKDLRLNRYVAIKMLHSHITNHSNIYKRFQNEAMISAQINHPHVTTLLDFIEENGRSYLIMEYVDGSALDELLQSNGPLDEKQCLDICIQMLKGLSEAHQLNILHRDLKPGNIMVNKKGFVKIMDFGIARMSSATRITAQNKVIGTAEYIAPEIYLGKEPTKVSDLYSIGIILYEMLSGDVLFKAESDASLIYQVVNSKPKIKLTGVSSELVAIIKKLTNKNPSKRYRSTEEVIDKLEGINKSSQGRSSLTGIKLPGLSQMGQLPSLSLPSKIAMPQFLSAINLNGPIKFLIISLVFSVIIIALRSTVLSDNRRDIREPDRVNELVDIIDESASSVDLIETKISAKSQLPITIEIPKSAGVKSPNKKPDEVDTNSSKKEETVKEQNGPKSSKETGKEKPQPITIEVVESAPAKISQEEIQPERNTDIVVETERAGEEHSQEVESVAIEERKSASLKSKNVYVTEQTIKIRFGSNISSGSVHEGQIVLFQSGQEIYVNGQLLIANGAPVKGRISKLKRKNNGKVHLGIQMLSVQSVHSDWLDLDYPEYSDIRKGEVVFPASTLLSKVKLKSQQTQIFY